MNTYPMKTFESPGDFFAKCRRLFEGPTLIGTFLSTDRKFAEKIQLAVAMTHNCHG